MTETLGNLGDFIGGFGVVVTVIYLAYQIRQNTASTRSATYQSVVADISEWTPQLGLSRDATRIFGIGLDDFEALSSEEQAQCSLLLASVVRHFENIHFQNITGAIDHDLWDGWSSRILGIVGSPVAQVWWSSQKSAFSNEFQAFTETAPEVSGKTGRFDVSWATSPIPNTKGQQ